MTDIIPKFKCNNAYSLYMTKYKRADAVKCYWKFENKWKRGKKSLKKQNSIQ